MKALRSVMYRIKLSCWDYPIIIISNNPEVVGLFSTIKHIAGIPVSIDKFVETNNFVYFHVIDSSSSSLSFDYANDTLTLCVEWATICDQLDVLTNLLGQLLSYSSWNDGVYPIHASAVQYGNKTLLFIGESNAGKTTLSVSLCSYRGAKWLANDWTALANFSKTVELVKGDGLINFSLFSYRQLRAYAARLAYLPDIEDGFRQAAIWKKSEYYTAEDIGLEKGEFPSPLGAVYFVNISPAHDFCCANLPKEKVVSLLLRELIWPLRGCGSFVIDNSGAAVCSSVSLTPKNGWDSVCSLVNLLNSSCPCYYLTGSLNSAIEYLTAGGPP